MKNFVAAYLATLVPMLMLDALWLSTMAKRFYGAHIGHLLAPSFRVVPALVFYGIYALGILVLVVLPALGAHADLLTVFGRGALLGLMAYATYDLTNQATMRDWPTIVSVVDLAWGCLLTGLTSVAACAGVRHWS